MADNRTATAVIRLKPSGLATIDQLAKDAGVGRSEMIRTLLAEAITARQKKRR